MYRPIEYRPAGQINSNNNVIAPSNPRVLGPEVDAELTAYAEAQGAVSDAAEDLNRYASKQAVTAAVNADDAAFREAVAAGKSPSKPITTAQDKRAAAEAIARIKLEQARQVANRAYAKALKVFEAEMASGDMWPRAVAELDAAKAELLDAVNKVQQAHQRVVSAHGDCKRVWDSATVENRSRFRGMHNQTQRITIGLGDLRDIASEDISHIPNPWVDDEQ